MSQSQCSLLPGIFGLLVQLVLFIVSMSVLVLKKKREERLEGENARCWSVFLLDSSKQLVGAGFMHCLNLITSVMFGNGCPGDACEWYLVNIVIDTTVGVVIAVALLKCMLIPAFEYCSGGTAIFRSGDYKDSSGTLIPKKYFAQTACWLLCLALTKSVVVLLMYLLQNPLHVAASGLLGIFPNSPQLQLVLAMVITPCFMNALQFWVQDAYLKHSRSNSSGGFCREPGDAARPLHLDGALPLGAEHGSRDSSAESVPELAVAELSPGKLLPRADDPCSVASTASTATS